jgi:hypothetical protein
MPDPCSVSSGNCRIYANELRAFVAEKHLERRWGELRPFFEPSFAAHISRLVAAQGGRPPPP